MTVRVWVPPYKHPSAGIRALHVLADELQAIGVDAECVTVGTTVHGDADVDVYPEVVDGHPGFAPQVVRWLLGRQRYAYPPGDMVVAWEPIIDPTVARLQVPVVEPYLFYPAAGERRRVVYWTGKHRGPVALPDRAVQITNDWPASRAKMAELLRSAVLLVTFDPFTAVNFEAVCCGTPVLVVGDGHEWSEEQARMTAWCRYGFAWSKRDLPRARREVKYAYDHYVEEMIPDMRATVVRFAERLEL